VNESAREHISAEDADEFSVRVNTLAEVFISAPHFGLALMLFAHLAGDGSVNGQGMSFHQAVNCGSVGGALDYHIIVAALAQALIALTLARFTWTTPSPIYVNLKLGARETLEKRLSLTVYLSGASARVLALGMVTGRSEGPELLKTHCVKRLKDLAVQELARRMLHEFELAPDFRLPPVPSGYEEVAVVPELEALNTNRCNAFELFTGLGYLLFILPFFADDGSVNRLSGSFSTNSHKVKITQKETADAVQSNLLLQLFGWWARSAAISCGPQVTVPEVKTSVNLSTICVDIFIVPKVAGRTTDKVHLSLNNLLDFAHEVLKLGCYNNYTKFDGSSEDITGHLLSRMYTGEGLY
jgi:hypothetical protein